MTPIQERGQSMNLTPDPIKCNRERVVNKPPAAARNGGVNYLAARIHAQPRNAEKQVMMRAVIMLNAGKDCSLLL